MARLLVLLWLISWPASAQKPPFLLVLGTAQDAGSPQIGCTKSCCANLWEHPDPTRKVVSLGLVDPTNQETYLFDATPDLPAQTAQLALAAGKPGTLPNAIFLTHAHIGHYTGLIYLGREATNSREVPVYAQDRLRNYLRANGPWSQLVTLKNISLNPMPPDKKLKMSPRVSVRALLVPHRDEFSETVGYLIEGPTKKALFIPDIDKWEKWERSIVELIKTVDYAFVDATFYSGDELKTRDMSQVPHPFVIESMALFDNLPGAERAKVQFIHFNHTNPLLNPASEACKKVRGKGYGIAQFGQRFEL